MPVLNLHFKSRKIYEKHVSGTVQRTLSYIGIYILSTFYYTHDHFKTYSYSYTSYTIFPSTFRGIKGIQFFIFNNNVFQCSRVCGYIIITLYEQDRLLIIYNFSFYYHANATYNNILHHIHICLIIIPFCYSTSSQFFVGIKTHLEKSLSKKLPIKTKKVKSNCGQSMCHVCFKWRYAEVS